MNLWLEGKTWNIEHRTWNMEHRTLTTNQLSAMLFVCLFIRMSVQRVLFSIFYFLFSVFHFSNFFKEFWIPLMELELW